VTATYAGVARRTSETDGSNNARKVPADAPTEFIKKRREKLVLIDERHRPALLRVVLTSELPLAVVTDCDQCICMASFLFPGGSCPIIRQWAIIPPLIIPSPIIELPRSCIPDCGVPAAALQPLAPRRARASGTAARCLVFVSISFASPGIGS
jgi:hypothetical protein